jgi:hypothetical protein
MIDANQTVESLHTELLNNALAKINDESKADVGSMF